MAIARLFQEFGSSAESEGAVRLLTEDALEDQRLGAFEQGYSAGWEDAVQAQFKGQVDVVGALKQSLEDYSFTYHEALGQIKRAIDPVFGSLMKAVLPKILADTAGPRIVEQLCNLAAEQATGPAEVIVAPGTAALLASVFESDFAVPIKLHEDKSVAPGQVFIRLGTSERLLDDNELLESIQVAIDACFHKPAEEAQNG